MRQEEIQLETERDLIISALYNATVVLPKTKPKHLFGEAGTLEEVEIIFEISSVIGNVRERQRGDFKSSVIDPSSALNGS
jgi:hypothetical protein